MGLFKKQQQSSDDVVAPDDPEAMTNLGVLAEEAGDMDVARAWYEYASHDPVLLATKVRAQFPQAMRQVRR